MNNLGRSFFAIFPKKGLEFIFGRVINVVQKLLFVSIPGNKLKAIMLLSHTLNSS